MGRQINRNLRTRMKRGPRRVQKQKQQQQQQQQSLHQWPASASAFPPMLDQEGFDMIILDLFDPADFRHDLVEKLYSDEALANFACLLRRDGILVAQIGETPQAMNTIFHQQPESRRIFRRKLNMLERLAELLNEDQSVTSQLFIYSTYVPSFLSEWSFAVLFTSSRGPNRFNSNAARVDLVIRERILPVAQPLQYFDGSVMESFSTLRREWQDAYCAQTERPPICDLFTKVPTVEDGDSTVGHAMSYVGSKNANKNRYESAVALQPSTEHTDHYQANRWEVVAATDIPQWTDLGLYDASTALRLSLEEYIALENFVEATGSKEYAEFLDFLNRYAYECNVVNGQYINERRYCTMSLALREIKRGEVLREDYGLFGK